MIGIGVTFVGVESEERDSAPAEVCRAVLAPQLGRTHHRKGSMQKTTCSSCFHVMRGDDAFCSSCGRPNPPVGPASKSPRQELGSEASSGRASIPWGTLFVFALLGLAFFTNPARSEHELRIRGMVRQESPVVGFLGGGWLVSKVMDYEDYVLFSLGTLRGEVVTIGAFGNVFP